MKMLRNIAGGSCYISGL